MRMLFFALLSCLVMGVIAKDNPGHVWVMKLRPGADPHAVARELGLTYMHAMQFGGFHAFERAHDSRVRLSDVSQLASENAAVEWHQRQVPRQQEKRSAPVTPTNHHRHGHDLHHEATLAEQFGQTMADRVHNFLSETKHTRKKRYDDDNTQYHSSNTFVVTDPLYPHQWHLPRIYAPDCWNRHISYRGNDALIAIVDDGIDYKHPDFTSRFMLEYSINFNYGPDKDVMPAEGDRHGTSASGVAVATGNNNVCGIGVCPDCHLAGIRLIAGPSTDYTEASGLTYKNDDIAVYSCSWGPSDDGHTMIEPGPVTKAALRGSATAGRHGKGNLITWAGGNGGHVGDNGNYDGYANSRWTIAVGAVAHDDRKAYYSEECACLMLCAPSSGNQGYGITTVSVRDGNGNPTCTNSFGGTSSAAPTVAGVFGLVLGKYPDLTRRDLLAIAARTARQVDPTDRDWTRRNANGVAHNHKYGWGMINVHEMAREATLWQHLPEELSCSTGQVTFNYVLGDGVGAYNWQADMPTRQCMYYQNDNGKGATINYVEYVEVIVHVHHTRRGDLSISLTDPAGVTSVLHEPHVDYNAYPSSGWTYGSARHWGQAMRGLWNIRVADERHNGATGTLVSLELIVHGHHRP